VFCRHNHDLKCILSGKSAKAAMFYISDYITKMGLKTYKMLSLLSRAVARLSTIDENQSAVHSAKALLHKCLSQFNRQQQIHAQQAARYLQGSDDNISSHRTVPMLSSLFLSYVKGMYIQANGASSESCDQEGHDGIGSDNSNGEIEHSQICVSTDKEGKLVEANQVHHYLHRADSLAHMCFYDFCRCVELHTKDRSKQTKNTHETCLGVMRRHALKPDHLLHTTHDLVKHTDELHMDHELVPRVIGMSMPCSNNKQAWALFTLSHFKAFSCDVPLFDKGKDPEQAFDMYAFLDYSHTIMANWEAIHECEDERDADWLHKQAQQMLKNPSSSNDSNMARVPDDDLVELESRDRKFGSCSQDDFRVQQIVLLLQGAGWLQKQSGTEHCGEPLPDKFIADELNVTQKTLA